MKPRWPWLVAALCATSGTLYAQSRADRVVVRVGEREITIGEVEKRLGQVPLFQLKSLGSSPDEVKRKFLEELISMDLLLLAAEEAKLAERPDVRDRIVQLMTQALLADLQRESLDAREVSDEEVKAYYDANRALYASQQRIKIWQIVVDDKAKADKLLDTIRSDPEYAKDPAAGWDELAREHSLDKSTAMRSGNLGFVQPDGQTAHKDVRVPKELFDAAAKVEDGQVVPEPVQVGDYWVVVQRRGSHVTPERTLESETPTIRGMLAREKVDKRRTELLAKLRERYVTDLNINVIDQIEITADGELAPQGRPGALRRGHPATGKGRPSGPPGDLR